ncbi:DUF4012 domain-containing protein [Pseudarthrobacter sp. S3]|uniref:DUF4012 domain-containing protein n=1 Tax=Pseudarthrobacter sp. S3 TaxID=3418419 RepID=UPI003CEFEBB2
MVALAAAAWLGERATTINYELNTASELIPSIKDAVAANDSKRATAVTEKLRSHTAEAKRAAEDPVWTLASSIPIAGPNFSAVSEVARSADDVATLGLEPLVKVFDVLDWDTLLPSSSGADLSSIEAAAPTVSSAAQAVRLSAERLHQIDTTKLLPQVADPLIRARGELLDVTGTLDAAAHASATLPAMLGSDAPRNYLLMIQNNAEARASGGIPGALAILSLDGGKLTLSAQSSAGELGIMAPTVPVDSVQQQIYSARLGKFMQDVNLTPDFPTAAATAQAMWERKTGQRVDGVLSIDPVALGYILDATGSVKISNPELTSLTNLGLPAELTGTNVVQTLLSDVYAKIAQPKLQDAYFAGVAQEIFATLSTGKADPKRLMEGIGRGASEGRILVWSDEPQEQAVIDRYPIAGAISGPSVAAAQFGVYFNDGTGAKMDYYVKHSVGLIKECPKDGYEQTTVRITSTNTAPADAATSLPAYVTGDGIFGVPPGSVQTNIMAYGPVQANVEIARLDGQKTEFAPYLHSGRPVGVLAVRLAPGESRTVEFTFGKIVQHTEPNLFVTPTVQDVNDVILPTGVASCGQ